MHGGHGFPATSAVALALVAAALAAYLEGARRDRRWPAGRTAAFGAGAAVLAVAFWPSVVTWAHGDLRGHMVQHVAVGMLAPLGLVLGAPVTLALRRLSVPRARAVTRVLNSQPVRFVSHPATALVLNLGGMTALYATPLYAAAAASPPLHAAVHVHTLAAGCLFTWAVLAGPDPAPARARPAGPPGRPVPRRGWARGPGQDDVRPRPPPRDRRRPRGRPVGGPGDVLRAATWPRGCSRWPCSRGGTGREGALGFGVQGSGFECCQASSVLLPRPARRGLPQSAEPSGGADPEPRTLNREP